MRTKHTRRCLAVVLAAVLLLGAAVGAVFWNRHRGATSVAVETTQENAAEQVVFFRQKDDRWKSDALGDSIYHMADSGCLTCCVAAALQMQQISVDGLPENADAGEVNQFFSERGVYDSAGNLLWEMLEQTAGVSVRKQDAAELQDGELDQELAAGAITMCCWWAVLTERISAWIRCKPKNRQCRCWISAGKSMQCVCCNRKECGIRRRKKR